MGARGVPLALALLVGCGGIAVVDPGTGGSAGGGSGGAGATGGGGGSGGVGATGGAGGAGATGGGGTGNVGLCQTDPDCPSTGCAQGVCVNGVCSTTPAPDGAPCDDGKGCTQADACFQGVCQGKPTPCSGFPPCSLGVCVEPGGSCELQPAPDGTPCDDADLCTSASACAAGVCEGQVSLVCPAGPCQVGACDPASGCFLQSAPNGSPCDDGDPCTVGDTCSNGACVAGAGVVFFADDFSTSGNGWELGPEWQIGPAAASSGQAYGNPDPPIDYTPGVDNGLAGVVIGGNAQVDVHPGHYLTSPAIDTSGAQTLLLSYRRFLNSDYTPFMDNTVEVWNGMAWVVVWSSGPAPGILDATWKAQTLDVSAHKNAQFRVRFGVTTPNAGSFLVSSWNVDDVVLAEGGCP